MVLLDDAFDKRQSQSPTALFGRETRVEDVLEVLARDTLAGVLDQDDGIVRTVLDGDVEASLSVHGVNGVLGQVLHHPGKQRLAQHHAVVGLVVGVDVQGHALGDTGAHILQIHNIKDNPFDPVNITRDGVISVRSKKFPVINDRKGWDMIEDINKAHEGGESLGGVIECAAVNVPAGIGSPVFDGLENNIAQLVFGIPGVRGLEFGAGFTSAKMVGSQNNDEFYVNDHGHVLTKTNNHGGIIGGISSGMPITLRVAMKPSEYTAGQQAAVNYRDMTSETVESEKNIPCTVPAAVPCVEAAVNIALLSNMLDYPNFC